jgi:hypothetical protein
VGGTADAGKAVVDGAAGALQDVNPSPRGIARSQPTPGRFHPALAGAHHRGVLRRAGDFQRLGHQAAGIPGLPFVLIDGGNLLSPFPTSSATSSSKSTATPSPAGSSGWSSS